MTGSPQRDRLAVVIPAYNAAATLAAVLAPFTGRAGIDDLVVVDPASSDGTDDVARAHGARVVRLAERQGPAGARNAGVAAVDAELILFVDSDCVVHDDVVARVREAFADDPGLVSITGSYDDRPPHRGVASLYMNLRHHHTHQHAARETTTFWAGCGAVRREAFQSVGGFDAARYPWPMIEDIELGRRLSRRGRMRLDPALQATHLKRWTFRSVVTTDIFRRAVPWSRLILETGAMPDDLNLRFSQRLAALLSPLVLLGIPAIPVVAVADARWLPVALLPLVLGLVLNRSLVGFFVRKGGLAFAGLGFLFHQFHLSYSAATFVLCGFRHRFARKPRGASS